VGRPFASPTVQACRDRFHYEIVEGAGGAAAVRFAGRDYSLQQVAALILKELREMASQALGEAIERAVVTVPAYYNDHQRSAVREAGQLAGLSIERIVNEPTAAALAFGYGKALDKRVLVYDLGGGTFDASVLEIQGDVYEVVSTGGDTFLGGVDFDAQLVDHLVYAFMEVHGFPPPDDRVVWQRIRDAAEETKVALSSSERAVARVPYLCKSPAGKDIALEVEVTRAELEALTERLVDRTIAVCREVLAEKGLGAQDVHEVLLVGGQSRMPLVWRKIKAEFGRDPNKSVHPDEAVALGAALLADSFTRIDAVVLIDVLAMGIGVGLPGGRMAPVLPRNTKLPAKKAYELGTTRDGQTELELQVFQGDSPKVSECEYLGTVRVPNLPARPRGGVKVAVEFALGPEGILKVTARDLATGQVTEAQFATVDSPESIRSKLQLPEAPSAPKGARPLETVPPSHAAADRKRLFGRLFGR
jgi:molecular chaperone DnaK